MEISGTSKGGCYKQRVNIDAHVCVCPYHLQDKKLSWQPSDGTLWQTEEVDIKT